MRVEITSIDGGLKIYFDDHFDDGSSHAILSPEHMDKVVEFYKSVRKG